MSFSSNIKEELSRNETGARHCKIAEIAGFLRFWREYQSGARTL